MEALDKGRDQFRLEQALLQSIENTSVYFLSRDGSTVLACALLLPSRTAISVLGDDRISAAAAPTAQQPRQEKARPMGGIQRVCRLITFLLYDGRIRRTKGCLALLYGSPQFVGHDS